MTSRETRLAELADLNGAVIEWPYRYRLWRTIRIGVRPSTQLWVMLNPSTADAVGGDPTLGRVVGFATARGFTRVELVNLYGLISPYPRDLLAVADPVGPDNDAMVAQLAAEADEIVCAWGTHRMAHERATHVLGLLRDAAPSTPLRCLGRTKDGSPRHPLYLANGTPFEPYGGPPPLPASRALDIDMVGRTFSRKVLQSPTHLTVELGRHCSVSLGADTVAWVESQARQSVRELLDGPTLAGARATVERLARASTHAPGGQIAEELERLRVLLDAWPDGKLVVG
jgi:hypothetical protein